MPAALPAIAGAAAGIAFLGTRGELKDHQDLIVVLASHELTEISEVHLNDATR